MSDLLPCPFCGGEADYAFHAKGRPNAWENECDHWVYCEEDDCFASVGMCESKEQAIAAWNRRAIPAADARAEALREAAAVAFTASTSKAPATERKKIAAAIRALIPETKP